MIARGWPCLEETPDQHAESISRISAAELPPIKLEDINVGPVTDEERNELLELLNEYRDCFSKDTASIGCAKSVEMSIRLTNEAPFTYRPYRMAQSEQEVLREIVADLLSSDIIRESTSDYSSPVLLVRKKNGEWRMCIDYRKLNSVTIKENYPLTRIDDQVDRLTGAKVFCGLDLKCGYHQLPIAEGSKKYTAFVTPFGEYEFNRMPFGLTNAPRVFQRLMSFVLKSARHLAALYLDDILVHAKTIREVLDALRTVLQLLREEGLTLNLSKCHFLTRSVSFLGFEVEDGMVKPGKEKVKAIEEFPLPSSAHNVRQYIGLTGYFRHFVKDYAATARPLTNLTRKTVPWSWGEKEEDAFRKLQRALIERPVLMIFDPAAETEVHTDASAIGLGGILLQRREGKLHPVAYYSRQTSDTERKYHSYELETLAVVESLKKFRCYLLGITFTVITDCNALRATSEKKNILPRIARWWLQLQEYSFVVQYRPGDRLKHADALSRNPVPVESVMRITVADWVLSGQLTDDRIKEIRATLSKPPITDADKAVYQNYALRDGRVYRITARGLLWVVPRGMRQQIVKAAHDELGHFGIEKTLQRLCNHYWFPRMRQYVENYIKCCIACLFSKRKAGKPEGFLNPIPKPKTPFHTVHIDHLGPFPKSKHGNLYVFAIVDSFTKFCILRALKSTKVKYVIDVLMGVCATYGAPRIIISDQGSSFTSRKFARFCAQNNITHVKNAVATPRANGQVERLNRSILSALMATTLEEELWDRQLLATQFAINNVPNKSTGKTPSELLYGYTPRKGSDIELKEEVSLAAQSINDIYEMREEAHRKIIDAQKVQKKYYDRRRKVSRKYKLGDLVLVEKQSSAPGGGGSSRKLVHPFSGPMIVSAVLPNDRYRVADMRGTTRSTRQTNYDKVVAVDKLKPWRDPAVLSDDTDEESGEDGVVLPSDSDSDSE